MSSPLVSIIIATYNRSNVLALTIESVRWQTFPDWELWVVGDACTDDTENVVATFAEADARIHFVNLERNVGEQSGPNNAGFQHARGRYIAYLNHDDFWLPDHLEAAVAALEKTGADLVFTLIDIVQKEGSNILSRIIPVTRREPPHSGGGGPLIVPASCWLLRREMVEEIGGWRFYQECYNIPSQDWLFRAWKADKKLRVVPRLTVVAVPSSLRLGSYAERQIKDHQLYFSRIVNEPDFRIRELAAMGFVNESEALLKQQQELATWCLWRPLHTLPWRLVRQIARRLCIVARIDPSGRMAFVRHLRKGVLIDQLRQMRGLPPVKRRGHAGGK
jgi:glycosyltransferase involved in cell wall biosynthesis